MNSALTVFLQDAPEFRAWLGMSDREILRGIAVDPVFRETVAAWRPFVPYGRYVAVHYISGLGSIASISADKITMGLTEISRNLDTFGKFKRIEGSIYSLGSVAHRMQIDRTKHSFTVRFMECNKDTAGRTYTFIYNANHCELASKHQWDKTTGFSEERKYDAGRMRLKATTTKASDRETTYDANGHVASEFYNCVLIKACIEDKLVTLRHNTRTGISIYSPQHNVIMVDELERIDKHTTAIQSQKQYQYDDHTDTWNLCEDD